MQRVTTFYISLLHTHTSIHNHSFTAVACSRLPTADVPLPLGSRTVPSLSYKFLTATAHNDWTAAHLYWLTHFSLVLLITSRHGPHRKHRCSVAAGMCLPSHCPETALVYLPISRSLHSNCYTHYSIETDEIVIECESMIWVNRLSINSSCRLLWMRRWALRFLEAN
jgi:hypothetical protein